MKILFCSAVFAPSIGGIEHVGALLAKRFERAGHEVVVVTRTPAGPGGESGELSEASNIVRRPRPARLRSLVAGADVVVHNQISLRLGWPLLWIDKPRVVVHHTWLRPTGHPRAPALLKEWALRGAVNIAVSQPLAQALPVPAQVVLNPYADDMFMPMPGIARVRDLVFVGRLVSDKGVRLLLQALARLGEEGLTPGLWIVGEGPEEPALRAHAERLGLAEQVRFVGPVRGAALAALFNAHRVAVVPSIWEEPFGLVALEAMACGCVPLVARSGGLPAAVGPAGRVFEKGNVAALARGIAELLRDDAARAACRAAAPAQLVQHHSAVVAARYLRIIESARRSHGAARAFARTPT